MLEPITFTIATIIAATVGIGNTLGSATRKICALPESISDQLLGLNTLGGEED